MSARRRVIRSVIAGVATISALAVLPSTSQAAYPPSGLDHFETTAFVFVTPVPGCLSPLAELLAERGVVTGPTTVRRGDPVLPADGREEIPTEIVALDLKGQTPLGLLGDIDVRLDPDRSSTGMVKQQAPGVDFPADSFFDVFVEVDYGPLRLESVGPVPMQNEIYSLPPAVFPYLPPPGTCIPLKLRDLPFDLPVMWLTHADHLPLPTRTCVPVAGSFGIGPLTGPSQLGQIQQGELELIHGLVPPGEVDVEMEALELRGNGAVVGSDGEPQPLAIDEPASTGSPGVLRNVQPGQSGLEGELELDLTLGLEGPFGFGVTEVSLAGSLSQGGGGIQQTAPSALNAPNGDPIAEITQLQLQLGTPLPCADRPYPPVDQIGPAGDAEPRDDGEVVGPASSARGGNLVTVVLESLGL